MDRVIPMLPEKLSNKVCSLRPNEEKLTFSAVFNFNKKGEINNSWFGRTIIKSNKRFSYQEAQEIIETKKNIISKNNSLTGKEYKVDKSIAESNKDFEVSHIHLNDQTVAGLRMKNKNCFSVQYHPEAGPRPNDATYLFDEFCQNIKNHSAKKVN